MAALRIAVRSSLRLFGTKFSKEVVPHVNKTLTSVQCAPLSVGRIAFNNHDRNEQNIPYKVEYIESQDPEEWKFVERLLPYAIVPEVVKKSDYPSGWKPPRDEATKLPYFVNRTKNHMIPVYMWIGHRGMGRRTEIKNISGDIWALEKELKAVLEEGLPRGKSIPSQVNEMTSSIRFKGDHVTKCQRWMEAKGF